jgi:histidinol-phosphatase (PHP family)
MVEFALAKGFDSLGFSGHSSMSYGSYGIPYAKLEAYKKEIRDLQAEYGGSFPIFLGMEVDMYSDAPQTGFDYLIGAKHYFKFGDEMVDFDRSAERVREVIDTWFGGDGMAFALRYYEELADLPQYGKFDFLAHYDIHTKNIEQMPFVDVTDKRYLDAAKETIHALRPHIGLFEVNTGAIARGYRTTPYPQPELVKEFKAAGYGAVITSDCHDGSKLDQSFDMAVELLKSCGYTEHFVLKKDGFVPMPL